MQSLVGKPAILPAGIARALYTVQPYNEQRWVGHMHTHPLGRAEVSHTAPSSVQTPATSFQSLACIGRWGKREGKRLMIR